MAFLNKKNQGRDCEYCNSTGLRMQGYATHLRIKHPEVWDAGKVLFPQDPAWEWPENLGQGQGDQVRTVEKVKTMKDQSARDKKKLEKLEITSFEDNTPTEVEVAHQVVANQEPSFTLGAGNALAIPVLGFYKSLVMGSPTEADRIDDMIDQIVEWQMQNPTKIRIPFSGGAGN